ncbi:hypothetical protein ACFHYQ_08135 [Sphaerimonospora cavernae]|uniref:Uncharacterized protein n=1 Tax=Sphaerimonospora cavernae TaxID=1740611 RepID=A0ABV6U1C9_9ACTN
MSDCIEPARLVLDRNDAHTTVTFRLDEFPLGGRAAQPGQGQLFQRYGLPGGGATSAVKVGAPMP